MRIEEPSESLALAPRRRRGGTVSCGSSGGFTLVEVVIAVAILGMIGTLVFGTFARAMSARDRAEEITGHYNQIRGAMLRMTREISSAFVSLHRDCEDDRTETVFKSEHSGGAMRLDFTSFSHFRTRADANESDQHEISYFIGNHPDDAKRSVLFRRHQSRIDEEGDEGGDEQVLAENVTDLSFEFYDPKDDRWGDDWDANESDHLDRLPMFVAVHIKALSPSGQEEEFTTKTRVFLQRAISVLGTGFTRCPR